MYTREHTRPVQVKGIQIGGQNRVVIQSMCSTKTSNVLETVRQIQALEQRGCQMVRLAIADMEDAQAIKLIKASVNIPLVADIHFDYRLAIAAIENGIDKIRLNPGNIGKRENVEAVVAKCKEHNIPIRIGVNGGSLEAHLLETYGKPCAEAMVESAKAHVAILEALDFHDIVLSFKASDVVLTIQAYELAAKTFPYPLHLGVTEAGTYIGSAIKSSAALGVLLNQGIGDTIRISVNGDPVDEITICKQLLKCFDLIQNQPNLIACPTCGRTQYDIGPIVYEIENFLKDVHADINVAIMGCAVNGPGEAKHADIAIAGGKNEGLLIKKGEIIAKVKQEEMVDVLKAEILKMAAEMNK
ncbi:MAG: flavodoxin-dependent (E)-4-hydroxy-3-methylbut-2-enyl-diphosphate synthase [Erysipelotrichaceae bacterium]